MHVGFIGERLLLLHPPFLVAGEEIIDIEHGDIENEDDKARPAG